MRFSSSETEIRFPDLSPPQRAQLHDIASQFGLESESHGAKNKRVLVITKPGTPLPALSSYSHLSEEPSDTIQVTEHFTFSGYISLRGPCVEMSAAFNLDQVPESFRAEREQRDGAQHHITLLARKEVSELKKKQIGAPQLLTELGKVLESFTCKAQ